MPRASTTAPWSVGRVHLRRVRGPRADGLVYWRAVTRDEEGAEVLVWTGWCERGDAAVAEQVLTDARRATEPVTETVRKLLGYWKADREAQVEAGELSAKSLGRYRADLRHLTAGLGEVLVDRLDLEAVRAYVRARRAVAASRTVQLELVTLRAAWNWGRSRGLTPERSLEVPRIVVERTRESYTPTPAEVAATLARTETWVRLAVLLLWSTGVRLGELATLTWDRVDLQAGTIEVRGKTRKRTVPVDSRVLRELKAVNGAEGRVLGVAVATAMSVGRRVHEACDLANVHRWSPQGLRRSMVDRLYEDGADVGTVAKLLGQSPEVALAHYREPRLADLRRAVDSVTALPVPMRRR